MGKQLTRRWTQEEDEFIKNNYLQLSDQELGEHIGRTQSAVRSERQKLDLHRPKGKRVIKNRYEKVCFADVEEMFNNSKYILLSNESEYKNLSSKLRYLCPDHMDKGELTISFGHFREGKGCWFCGRERTNLSRVSSQTEEDDRKLCEEKGFEYISTQKINGIYYINFICNKHRQLGIQHMRRGNMNRDMVQGCQYCINKNLPEWYIKQEIESKYPFQVLSKYNGMNKELECYCLKHKSYFSHDAKYIYHNGSGCEKCVSERRVAVHKLSEDEIIKRIYIANPDLEVISIENYISVRSYITVRCKKCGHIWDSPIDSLFANGTRCPLCCTSSKGEQKIISILEQNNYIYEIQYKFEDCRHKKPLPFDNSILNEKKELIALIEYHGEQHYFPVKYFGGETKFEETKCRDKIKEEYCKKHNIPLLVIPYWEFDNIEDILLDFLNKLKI